MENALYVVATPIGNLQDITLRGIEVLNNVDIIFCEDTRVTNKLLAGLKIGKKSLFIYNDFTSDFEREKIIKLLLDGKSIALVSDAGTPLISDPGFKLVRECKNKNIKVIPIVGASALLATLSASGLPTDKFLFYGFLSEKESERKKELENLKNNRETIVFYESPKRFMFTINNILEILGDIDVCIARELTKEYEEIKTDTITNIIKYYTANQDRIRGEFVIAISNNKNMNTLEDEKIKLFHDNLKEFFSLKEISDFIIKIGFEYNKKELYNKLLEIKNNEVKNEQ